PHMQRPGDVWRGDDDCKRLLAEAAATLGIAVEVTFIVPERQAPLLGGLGVVFAGELTRHRRILRSGMARLLPSRREGTLSGKTDGTGIRFPASELGRCYCTRYN